MNIPSIGKRFPLLLVPALMAMALIAPPAAAETCACMCVDGEPYYVCNSGFGGYTQEPTPSCTEQLADTCPTPGAQPEGQTTEDPPSSPEPATEPDPVNAAARDNGLDCKPRQVYRPDLAAHKVYTVCMPSAMAAAQTRRSERARNDQSRR